MAKELDKVIKIGTEDYNVNAVEATHVKNSLKINKANLTSDGSTKLAEFNGETEISVNLVPADGGKFRGPISVYNAGSELTTNKNKKTNGEFQEDAVLNYSDIKNVILANIKNNAIAYNWDGTEVDATFEDNSINSISVVHGSEDNVQSFASFNNTQYQNKKSYLPTYFYISTPNNKVYYGTATSSKAELLDINSAGTVSKADQLTNSRTIQTNLESTQAIGFNGTADIKPGVTGILDPAHGGTGTDSLNSVTVGYAQSAYQLQDSNNSNNTKSAAEVIEAVLSYELFTKPVSQGTRSVSWAAWADKAGKLGEHGAEYYQKKITIESAADYPFGPDDGDGADGDIMILY